MLIFYASSDCSRELAEYMPLHPHKQKRPQAICMLDVALWTVKIEEIYGGNSEHIQDRHLSYFRIFLEPGKVFAIYTYFQKA